MGIYGPSVRQIIGEIMRLGPLGTFRKIYYMNILKVGTLVGVDQFGNQYYENRQYPHPKDRWVEYGNLYNSDPSTVPAEWFGWLHHMIDLNPHHPDYHKLNPKYRREHLPNLTGTKYRYLPHGHLLNKEAKPVQFNPHSPKSQSMQTVGLPRRGADIGTKQEQMEVKFPRKEQH